jgi:hypothetical protein
MSVFFDAEYLKSTWVGAIYSSMQFPALVPWLKSHRTSLCFEFQQHSAAESQISHWWGIKTRYTAVLSSTMCSSTLLSMHWWSIACIWLLLLSTHDWLETVSVKVWWEIWTENLVLVVLIYQGFSLKLLTVVYYSYKNSCVRRWLRTPFVSLLGFHIQSVLSCTVSFPLYAGWSLRSWKTASSEWQMNWWEEDQVDLYWPIVSCAGLQNVAPEAARIYSKTDAK